jgi:tetratricopeptide (TPR) repeat protein
MGNLAVAYLRAARLEDARRACGEALRSRPDYPEGLKTLGLIDLAEGRRVEGQARLRRAIELREDLPEAEVALAELSERSGDWRDALERYRRLVAKAEAYRAKDYHRRWKDLFHPATRSTEEELADRIGRLASRLAAEPLGHDVGLEPQGKETKP